jgi:hypothetical protein
MNNLETVVLPTSGITIAAVNNQVFLIYITRLSLSLPSLFLLRNGNFWVLNIYSDRRNLNRKRDDIVNF